MEQYKEKYPDWFDEEGNYIPGSLENQIERTKDNIRTYNNAVLYGEETEFNLANLKLELEILKGLAELDAAKKKKLNEITAYDASESVNIFTLNDFPVWYDKATRVSIKNQIESRQMLGQETAPIEFGGTILQIPIEQGLGMLAQLEVYASDCYNRTALHKAEVEKLKTKEEVEAYDYKTGYPEKLKFEL